jgi:hypothetical protein
MADCGKVEQNGQIENSIAERTGDEQLIPLFFTRYEQHLQSTDRHVPYVAVSSFAGSTIAMMLCRILSQAMHSLLLVCVINCISIQVSRLDFNTSDVVA